MNQNNNNLKLKKENDYSNKSEYKSSCSNDKVKSLIMEKYDLSPQEAERILSKIKKEKKITNNSKKEYSNNNKSNSNLNECTGTNHQIGSMDDSITDFQQINESEDIINNNKFLNKFQANNHGTVDSKKPYPENKQKLDNNLGINNNKQIVNKNSKIKSIEQIDVTNQKPMPYKFNSKEMKDVDSILEDILPDYNQQISIKLEHVNLTFEVQNEKIDTIKEEFIRTLKRNKSKKIKIHALKDVSFQIYKGEKVGIVGYNGASKSTLLNVIAGIYPPDNGSVTTYGNISPLLSLGAGFDYNSSGRQNIMLNGAILGYEKDFLESKMDEIIEFSELGEFIDIPIKNYSKGMLAKLGFSIAAAVNPDILIIDEILGVGDVNFVKKSFDKIRSLMDGGTTVLLVSHSIPKIRDLCDKAIWMDNGTLRLFGEVNEVCDEYLKDAQKASKEQLMNIKLME